MDSDYEHPGWENLASYIEKTIDETHSWAEEMANRTTHHG